MNTSRMQTIGLTEALIEQSKRYPDFIIGRVTSQHKELYRVFTENGERTAEVSGKFRFGTTTLADFPAVGDFVMLDRSSGPEADHTIIQHVLPRKSVFVRKAAGTSNAVQVVAANIDTVLNTMD